MNRHLARAKRAAEESNRMKGIFIRNITHEINRLPPFKAGGKP